MLRGLSVLCCASTPPPLAHTVALSVSLLFFLTLTATGPHLEIHHQRKAAGMKTAAVIYELL